MRLRLCPRSHIAILVGSCWIPKPEARWQWHGSGDLWTSNVHENQWTSSVDNFYQLVFYSNLWFWVDVTPWVLIWVLIWVLSRGDLATTTLRFGGGLWCEHVPWIPWIRMPDESIWIHQSWFISGCFYRETNGVPPHSTWIQSFGCPGEMQEMFQAHVVDDTLW